MDVKGYINDASTEEEKKDRRAQMQALLESEREENRQTLQVHIEHLGLETWFKCFVQMCEQDGKDVKEQLALRKHHLTAEQKRKINEHFKAIR